MKGGNTVEYWNKFYKGKITGHDEEIKKALEGKFKINVGYGNKGGLDDMINDTDIKGRVLHLGSGMSRALIQLSLDNPGVEFHALDLSPYAIKILSLYKINAKCFDIKAGNKLPYPDDYFDIAMSRSFLEHISKKDNYYLANEVKRVLKSNGKYLVDCSSDTWGNHEIVNGKIKYGEKTHIWQMTKEEFDKLHKGFNMIHYHDEANAHCAIYEVKK